MNERYSAGFEQRCREAGVAPHFLVKLNQALPMGPPAGIAPPSGKPPAVKPGAGIKPIQAAGASDIGAGAGKASRPSIVSGSSAPTAVKVGMSVEKILSVLAGSMDKGPGSRLQVAKILDKLRGKGRIMSADYAQPLRGADAEGLLDILQKGLVRRMPKSRNLPMHSPGPSQYETGAAYSTPPSKSGPFYNPNPNSSRNLSMDGYFGKGFKRIFDADK